MDRPRVEVRLEERDDPPAVPHGGDVGGELGGMVRVAVEDAHATRLALRLEAASSSRELDDDALGVGSSDACELERGERRGRIPAVVLARHRELERDRLEFLRAYDVQHAREPLLEERLELCARGELRVVVEVQIEEDGDLGLQGGDGAVGLVALDDQPALPRPRVAAELRDLAADEKRRIRPSWSRQNAIIALVVVLPCAPAITIARRRETSSARSSARGFPATCPANAVETYASQPDGGVGGSGEISTATPSRCRRYGVSTRSQPATSAPHARARSA